MTREMGKVLDETRGDVQEAIDMTYYMAGEGRRQFGQTTPSEMPDKFQMSVRQPVGIAGLITPWNFPMAIPSWKMMPALVLGQHGGDQARHRHSPVGRQPREGARGGRPAEGRREHGDGQRLEGGHAAHGPPRRRDRLLHRLDRRGPQGLGGLRPRLQALPPRDGRQERHHGDGRRAARPRGRGRPLGRLRHHGPALHRRQPGGRAPEGVRASSSSASWRGRRACGSATGSTRRPRWARASTRPSSRPSRAT